MSYLEFDSSNLLTMISINMTIIGLTSLAETKAIIENARNSEKPGAVSRSELYG